MPPKKTSSGPSKKTEQKKKEKVIEVSKLDRKKLAIESQQHADYLLQLMKT